MTNQNPNVKDPTNKTSQALSIAEQEAIVKEEIQKFIKLGKEKTALTIEEINELLPPEITAASVLDMFMHGLEKSVE